MRQKELDAELNAIQLMKLVGHLKDNDAITGNGTQLMFVLTFSEKKNKFRLTFSEGSVTVL